jgi:hypothetical protein
MLYKVIRYHIKTRKEKTMKVNLTRDAAIAYKSQMDLAGMLAANLYAYKIVRAA